MKTTGRPVRCAPFWFNSVVMGCVLVQSVVSSPAVRSGHLAHPKIWEGEGDGMREARGVGEGQSKEDEWRNTPHQTNP